MHTVTTVQTLVQLRFPILTLVFLTFWALLGTSVGALRPIAGNIALVDNYWQIGVIALVNGLAVIFAVSLTRAVFFRIKVQRPRVDESTEGEFESLKPWGLGTYINLAFATVTPLTVYFYSVHEGVFEPSIIGCITALLITLLGLLLSVLMMWTSGFVSGALIGNVKGVGNFFPGEDRDQKAKLVDLSKHPSKRFDVQMAIYFLIILGVYFFVLNGQEEQLSWMSVPTCLIILAWILMAALTLLGYLLDRFRIPVTLIAIVAVVVGRMINPSPYLLPSAPALSGSKTIELNKAYSLAVQKKQAAQEEVRTFRESLDAQFEAQDETQRIRDLDKLNSLEDESDANNKLVDDAKEKLDQLAWNAIKQRMSRVKVGKDQKKTVVIITCPGGGIHAAAWSAHALEQLNSRYTDLVESICVISGVSGGSVGSAFFVNSRFVEKSCVAGRIDQWQNASRSSLESVSAGLAFHDIPGVLIPLPGKDRGDRLESQWRSRFALNAESQTVDAWGQLALDGQMPIVVFNATDAVSGRRVLFSSVPTPRRPSMASRLGRPLDYRELINYQNTDVHVTTAARASATFPYVSPFTRPASASSDGDQVAICDGGYADNEGIVTAVDWVDFLVRQADIEATAGRLVPFQRIFVLRIQPQSDHEQHADPGGIQNLVGHLRWLTGPVEALVSMRTSSQVERGQLEVDLAVTYIDTPWWKGKANADAPQSGDANSKKSGIAASKIQSKLDKGNVLTQKTAIDRIKSPGSNKPKSDNNSKSNNKGETADELNLSSQAFSDTLIDPNDYPVVTATIPFMHPEPDQGIPLNWRLSPRQLKWYPKAWQILVESAAQSSGTQELSVFQLLDTYFERRPTQTTAILPSP